MSLPLPKIDNVDFEQLVEQARGLIPRYADVWTDHNVHDPGIMLIELVAWIVDQQIFTAGFVSDEHLAAFASLLGVSSKRASPARGLIWPDDDAIVNNVAALGVNLAAGALAVSKQQPKVLFRTIADVYLTPAKTLAMPRSLAGHTSVPDVCRALSAANRTRIGEDAVHEILFDRPLIEGPDPRSYPVAIGVELAGSQQDANYSGAEGRISVDYRLESSDQSKLIDPWRRVDLILDTTWAFSRTGVFMVRIPVTELQTDPALIRHARLRIRQRYRINPTPPSLRRIGVNVLPIEQFQTIASAVIGTGTGHPDQSLAFETGALISTQLPVIEVVESGNFVAWERVDNFKDSKPVDRHYAHDESTGSISFGNGINGRVPPNGAQIRHRSFPVTLGEAGNFAAGLDWSIRGAKLKTGVERFGSNVLPMSGGKDAWGREELRAAARKRAIDRVALVSNKDLANVGEQLRSLGVTGTDVLVGFDPVRPQARLPGTRTLLITPGTDVSDRPLQYLSAVQQVVTPYRVLGERLNVAIKTQTVIDVAASVLIDDVTGIDTVYQAIKEALSARLSMIQRHDDISPWPPGREITLAELMTLIANVADVETVLTCKFARHGDKLDKTPVPIDKDSVATLGTVSLSHRFHRERED